MINVAGKEGVRGVRLLQEFLAHLLYPAELPS